MNGVRLIAGGDLAEVGVAFEESKTNHHLLAEICQNATIYRSANPHVPPLIAPGHRPHGRENYRAAPGYAQGR